jgi:SAM-dependent methyltransferase
VNLNPWVVAGQPFLHDQLAFALGRFDEGAGFVRYFERARPSLRRPPRDVLDLGTGNGGIAFAFANCPRYRVSAIDIGQNRILRQFARRENLPVGYALASGHELPYAAESFDLVLLIETIEHLPRPRRLGEEIMRVLRPGGVCLVTTPARLRYLFAPDPHYGVRFVAGLPNFLQRFAVNRIARRRITSPDGGSWPAYDVERLYWHVREIAGLLPDPKTVDVLFAQPPSGGPFLTGAWWRRKFRNFLFNHVLISKGSSLRAG